MTIEHAYSDSEKNDYLRCKICYHFPQFDLDEEKKIRIKYPCNHITQEDIINPEIIFNYKFSCAKCNKNMKDIDKNYLCSKCKQLFCSECYLNHFISCLSLFFIPLWEVGYICPDHRKKNEFFCLNCCKNMCSECKQEHMHFTKYSIKEIGVLTKDEKENILNRINSDDKSPNVVKNCVKNIIASNKYSEIPQFHQFFKKLIGNLKIDCGLFQEFGNKEFNEYYSSMINEAKNGNLYYRNIYNRIKILYESVNKKINIHPMNEVLNPINYMQIYMKNVSNISMMNQFYKKISDINREKKYQNLILENDKLKLKEEKSDIKIKALNNIDNKFKLQSVRLLNRTFADKILRFIIAKYPDNFNKISMNLKIYSNIHENFNDTNPNLINKIQILNAKIFEKFIIQIAPKLNMQINSPFEHENEDDIDTDITEEESNALKFEKCIKYKDLEISIKELNYLLNFLFYIKELGNLVAHPKNIDNNTSLNVFDSESLNKDTNMELKDFTNKYMQIFRGWKFSENANPKNMLECLFDWKYDSLIRMDQQDINYLDEDIDCIEEINNEFEELNNLVKSFELLKDSLKICKINIKNKIDISQNKALNEFRKNLIKVLNRNESVEQLFNHILLYEYENSIIRDNQLFISGCLYFIIDKLIDKINNKIPQLNQEIQALKKERNKQREMLKLFKDLNQRATELDVQEKTNLKNIYFNDFVTYFNQNVEDNKKIKIEQVDKIMKSIRKNLEILLTDKIKRLQKEKIKLTSLLYLCQNKLLDESSLE